MTNSTLIGAFMESRMNYDASGAGYDILSYSEAESYTLESGASLIAQQCRDELHEVFELAIIEQNEAVLGAYMEGCSDVMESNEYGPVFEAAEKSVGKRIVEFLTKLKDRVVAFFKNIFTKISEMFHNYDKFLKDKGMDMKRAKPVGDVYLKDWNDSRIDGVTGVIQNAASVISSAADWAASECSKMLKERQTQTDGEALRKADANFDQQITVQLQKLCNTLTGVTLKRSDYQGTTANSDMQALFVGEKKKKVTVNFEYIEPKLKDVKGHAKNIKTAEKNFDKAYKDAIKKLKSVTDEMERSEKKGISPYLSKTTSMLSKMQAYVNAYASAGYRALIGRANEARQMAGVLLSGSVPEHLKKAN